MTQKMTLGYRYFVRKTLEAQFVHGTSMGEYQAEFEDISRIAHRLLFLVNKLLAKSKNM